MLQTRLQRQSCRILILVALLVGALAPTGQLLAAPVDLPSGANLIEWILDWWAGDQSPGSVVGSSESVPDDGPSGDPLAPGINCGETSNTTTTTTGSEGDVLPDWDPNG